MLAGGAVLAGCSGQGLITPSGKLGDGDAPQVTLRPDGTQITTYADGTSHTIDHRNGDQRIRFASGGGINISTSGQTVTASSTTGQNVFSATLTATAFTFSGPGIGTQEIDPNALPSGTFDLVGHTLSPLSSIAYGINGPTVVGSASLYTSDQVSYTASGTNRGYTATQVFDPRTTGGGGGRVAYLAPPHGIHTDADWKGIGGVIISGIGFLFALVCFAAAIIAEALFGLALAAIGVVLALIALIWSIFTL